MTVHTVQIPELTRDEAAAAWFLFLAATANVLATDRPELQIIAQAILTTAQSTAEQIKILPPKSIQLFIHENAAP